MILAGDCNSLDGRLVGSWFEQNSGYPINSPYSALGFVDVKNKKIKGAVIFVDYNGANIELHVHAPRCLNKYNFKLILNYVFNEQKCIRLTAKPYRSNQQIIDILYNFGFKYEGVLKNYYGCTSDKDALVFYMLKDQAQKWIKINA